MFVWTVAKTALACMFVPIHCNHVPNFQRAVANWEAHTNDRNMPNWSDEMPQWHLQSQTWNKISTCWHKHSKTEPINVQDILHHFIAHALQVFPNPCNGPCISNLTHPCVLVHDLCVSSKANVSSKRVEHDLTAMLCLEQRSQYILPYRLKTLRIIIIIINNQIWYIGVAFDCATVNFSWDKIAGHIWACPLCLQQLCAILMCAAKTRAMPPQIN